MNILTVKKTIPFKGIVVDELNKNIKSVLYNLTYTLRTQQTADISYEEAHIRQNVRFFALQYGRHLHEAGKSQEAPRGH